MKANIYRCEISELAVKKGIEPSNSFDIKEIKNDPGISVVEYQGVTLVFDENIVKKPHVYLVVEDVSRIHTAYLSVEKAIDDFLQRKGWGGIQKPSVHIGINIEGGLYAMNNSDMWHIKPIPLSD